MEIWKEIADSKGKYFVSNLGNIRSNNIILKSNKDNKGYERIKLSNWKTIKVHREVAKAFIPNIDNKPQINHIDCNKSNNNANNLEWVTNKENCGKAYNNGLFNNSINMLQKYNKAKQKPILCVNIENGNRKIYQSISEAERELNTKHITDVLKGKRSQTKGFFFEYILKGGDVPNELTND